MTLQEAIEIKVASLKGDKAFLSHTLIKADRLLIEAGNRLFLAREGLTKRDDLLLPGETKE